MPGRGSCCACRRLTEVHCNLGGDFNGRPAPSNEGGETAANSSASGHSKTAQKILRTQKQPPGPTLFYGNLGFETTDASIRTLLESHRQKPASKAEPSPDPEKWIRKIRMGTFEDSGKCKGCVAAYLDPIALSRAGGLPDRSQGSGDVGL